MIRSIPAMGTIVTIQVEGHDADPVIERAFGWFQTIEGRCSRFDPQSELMRLSASVGVPVPVSPVLFEAVGFALAVSRETEGAFDPAVGQAMQARGYNREYRTGAPLVAEAEADAGVSYRDIHLDPESRSVTLRRSLTLDLGAVAKGFALDMAARELQAFEDFAIDAGGDLYLRGSNPNGRPWSVGIRHPRHDGECIESLCVSDQAVCTSGDYERGRHILDPRTGEAADSAASVTVLAPTAMMADALATAAFVLGPVEGIRLLDRMGVDGIIFTPALVRHATRGLRS